MPHTCLTSIKSQFYCTKYGYFVLYMSLFVTSLNSGSNGNCYYIGNTAEAVLIDAGISCRETEKRMKRLGLDITKVKAIFISHEHGDHIHGIDALVGKYQIPVFITPSTMQNSRVRFSNDLLRSFTAYKPVNIGNLSVLPFPKMHDASDPHSFVISGNGATIGVFTDIGNTCDNVINNFKRCNAVFLEANYDDEMLEQGRYPPHLKKRISGDHGHLSNQQALDLFIKHKPAFMSHLYLSHLSKDNNSPELALKLFAAHAGDTNIIIASRYKETALYQIYGDGKKHAIKTPSYKTAIQQSLF